MQGFFLLLGGVWSAAFWLILSASEYFVDLIQVGFAVLVKEFFVQAMAF